MTEKTEAQLEREKAAVSSMKNAKSNMDEVLARVSRLESALSAASRTIKTLKGHVGSDSMMRWHDGARENLDYVTKYADGEIAAIAKVLS